MGEEQGFVHEERRWVVDAEGLRPGGWYWGLSYSEGWRPLRFPNTGSLSMVRAMRQAGRVAIKPEHFEVGDLVEARDGEVTLEGVVSDWLDLSDVVIVEAAEERFTFSQTQLTLIKPAHSAPGFDAQLEAIKSALWERREKRDV